MLECPNCHAQLEDDALFCDSCGTRIEPPQAASETVFCPECGQPVDASSPVCPHCSAVLFEAVFCPNCGTPATPDTEFCQNCGFSLKAENQAGSAQAPETKTKKKPKKGFVFAGIGAAAVVVLVLAVFFLGKGTGASSNYAMYIKDKELYYNGFSKNDPRQISSRLLDKDSDESDLSSTYLSAICRFSKDGSLLFFPDRLDSSGDGYSLYYCKIDKPKEEAVKIDSNVTSYFINDDASSVTYMKNNTLYQYNRKKDDKQKIASDVTAYRVSDDGKTVLYLNNEGTLYYTVKGGDRDKIDSDISDLSYVSDDLSVIFYLKEDILYKKENGGDREKISSDVKHVIKAYDTGEVYYARTEEEELSLSDFVIDDKKNEDAALREPEYPNTSWSDPARDTKMEAYNQAMEEYYLKQNRDYLREELKEYTFISDYCTLCYYDGSNESIVSETYYPTFSASYRASNAPVIAYRAYDQSEEITVKLSEIENIYSIDDQIRGALYDSEQWYVATGSNSEVLEADSEIQGITLAPDGKTLYYFDDVPEDKNYGELYQVSVSSSGELGDPKLYDDDVCTNNLHVLKDGHLLYYKDFKNSNGELYIDKEKIDYDVYSYSVNYDEDANRVTYFSDWNDEKQYGTLSTCSIGKEAVKIADDAHTFCVMPNENVLYLYDYSLKRYQGDLYLWDKKKAEKIDDSVYAILTYVY